MGITLNQMSAVSDPRRNLGVIEVGIAMAARSNARVAVFPEGAMACFGTPLDTVAEPLNGPWAEAVRAMARRAGITVVVGMFTPGPDGRVRNTLLITGPEVDTHYDKIHLFDAFDYRESDTVAPGRHAVTFQTAGVTFGVATCYDLRFPELFTELAGRGAQVILVPASWGDGPAKLTQWELLVRARALDSTSWVLACDQADPRSVGREPIGGAPSGVGNSLAVSPWGEITSRLGRAPDLLVVDPALEEVVAARRAIPVLLDAARRSTRNTADHRKGAR